MRVGNRCMYLQVWMGGCLVMRVRAHEYVNAWVRRCVSGWVLGCVSSWLRGRVARGCVRAWVLGCVSAWVQGRVGGWISDCVWLSGAWEKRIVYVSGDASERASA